jgi:diguanylate cyclase (GGDEF)-like protein
VSDAACRYGGDEFVVVLTNADAADAAVFAERLLARVEERSRGLTPPPPWAPASVTAGIAAYPGDGLTVAALIECADGRLYRGKRLGGGRVGVSEPAR